MLRPEQAFAWGPEGHDIVAIIADHLIAPGTRAKFKELLAEGGHVDLGSVACWADDVILAARGEGPLTANAEAKEFNNRFPTSRRWHFINLPLGTLSFEEARRFTPPESIVQAISRCIQVLESPVANPQEFTRLQALRLLAHLVGDVHQPLHCGTGYYRVDKPGTAELITDPGEALGKSNDRGGNLLFYGMTSAEQLHAFWDIVIVQAINNTADPQALADLLLKEASGEDMTKTPGRISPLGRSVGHRVGAHRHSGLFSHRF